MNPTPYGVELKDSFNLRQRALRRRAAFRRAIAWTGLGLGLIGLGLCLGVVAANLFCHNL